MAAAITIDSIVDTLDDKNSNDGDKNEKKNNSRRHKLETIFDWSPEEEERNNDNDNDATKNHQYRIRVCLDVIITFQNNTNDDVTTNHMPTNDFDCQIQSPIMVALERQTSLIVLSSSSSTSEAPLFYLATK